jgi:5-methylcytosine-specific restriction protein B
MVASKNLQMTDPESVRVRLDAAIRDETDPSSTRTGKFRALRTFAADLLGLEVQHVAPLFVNKPANTDNRAGQPGAKGKKVAFAIAKMPERAQEESDEAYEDRFTKMLASYENRARVVVGGGLVGAMVICTARPGARWNVSAIVERVNGGVAPRLLPLFPSASLINPTAEVPDEPDAESGAPVSVLPPAETADLAETLFVDEAWIEDVLWMLYDKRSLVLYGPPGTGKTFIAQKIAAHVQADASRRRIVQLHPSYSYEDFFEGYRPRIGDDGRPSLKLEWGPLRDLADLAEKNPTQPVVMVMDEMNRGNLPRVFGELFFVLEYREQAVGLMYSPSEAFRLPKNLYLIATMNTADRSIALIDQALRRRFHFAGLFPGERPVDQMLRKFLEEHRPDMRWVAVSPLQAA